MRKTPGAEAPGAFLFSTAAAPGLSDKRGKNQQGRTSRPAHQGLPAKEENTQGTFRSVPVRQGFPKREGGAPGGRTQAASPPGTQSSRHRLSAPAAPSPPLSPPHILEQ